MDNLKAKIDRIHDDLVERYPEQKEGLDLYQAYIQYEFKVLKEQFNTKELAKELEKVQGELEELKK